MIALSTAFNISRCRSWQKLLTDVKKTGYAAVELNVEIPAAWMPEIAASVEKNEITVTSLHNYCPAVDNLPEGRTIYSGYLLTSDDEDERLRARELTLRTIEWAGELGARAVVIHAGEVPTDPSGREYFRYIQQFGPKGPLFGYYRDAVLEDRRKKSPVYLERLLGALDRLLPAAEKRGVVLGLENRFFIHEMPSIDELLEIFERYPGAPIGYWHDTGHAEVFVRLGWVKRHLDFLEQLGQRLVGCHLHDIKGISDHYAPGCGDFDFSMLSPFITEKTIKVIEAHSKSSPDEVRRAREALAQNGIA